ncbi:acyl carrier protein [Pedobacter psychroterrae]|uniref:Acyl carrier protein n=1 Tax=Pedobacter psychroterrae TaxID=2530453 RepID=A0A4V2MK44_9SPHI|nr:acyl carrier protein [Pedobacter psychroterrae]TCC96816.1 acyl carrier protein [Pedobacter psychroterrae]
MDRIEILRQINIIFAELLDNQNIQITEATVAYDIEDWDSLMHLQLAVAIEKNFEVRFNLQEIQSWVGVKDIIDSVVQRLN